MKGGRDNGKNRFYKTLRVDKEVRGILRVWGKIRQKLVNELLQKNRQSK